MLVVLGIIVLIIVAIAGGSYNGLVKKSQAVDSAWATVQTDYQRRADLIPNLVATVSGAANFEKSTLVEVTQARALRRKSHCHRRRRSHRSSEAR